MVQGLSVLPFAHVIIRHGGLAVLVYTLFYVAIFGIDEVKWMFINAVLGATAIASQMNGILSLTGKKMSDFPFYVHAVPFLYFVLYTFLLRQAVLDIARARYNETRRKIVEGIYVAAYLAIALFSYLSENR